MWIQYNPNPTGARVGDCAVRAVAKAIGTNWDTAFASIALAGFVLGDMPSSNAVWGSFLRSKGFDRFPIPDTYPQLYTAEDFCRDHPTGTYVLAFGGHVATVVDGDLYDSWNSLAEIPLYFYAQKEVNTHGL